MEVELGWPVLRPLWRGWTWFGRIAVGLVAASSLLRIVDVVNDGEQRPPWQWALIVAGAGLALVASAGVWVLAGRMQRTVWEFPDPGYPPPATADYRAARRSLRTGAVLTDRQRRLVAYEMGQLGMLTAYLGYIAAQIGLQILNWSSRAGPPADGLIPVGCGLMLVALGGSFVVLRRFPQLRNAAARVGAVPIRPGAHHDA